MSIQVTISGRLGAEPEFKISANGTAICSLRIATNRRRKNGETWEDYDTTWWDITFFGATAEAVAQQAVKGDRIIVTGRVRDEKWTAPDGTEKSKKAVIGDDFGIRRKADSSTQATPAADPWGDDAPF